MALSLCPVGVFVRMRKKMPEKLVQQLRHRLGQVKAKVQS